MMTLSLNLELPQGVENIKPTNPTSSFLPVITNNNEFDWNQVAGLVMGHFLSVSTGKLTLDKLREKCKAVFSEKLADPEFWEVIEKMYFAGDALLQISPEFLLLNRTGKLDKADQRIANTFNSLLRKREEERCLESSVNFIEKEIINVLRSEFRPNKQEHELIAYLPFLAETYSRDLEFLTTKPGMLLAEFRNFLELYGFLYCAQLALNVREWRAGRPQPKSLYFILENEKASQERTAVANYGFKGFNNAAWHLFPMLSMLEILLDAADIPRMTLWQLGQRMETVQNDALASQQLRGFATAFAKQRSLNCPRLDCKDAIECLEVLMELSCKQFEPGQSRRQANERVVRDMKEKFGANFIQNRGRAGNVLVLNQDYIILLVNLAVGVQEKLRLHELIEEFKARGIFLDKQSEQQLIGFLERIGNVERMSDSGDAVYVRKTI